MINVSALTNDIKTVASALSGKWERYDKDGTTWVILGQIAFVEGDVSKFPYEVLSWHSMDDKGHWGILSNAVKRK